MLGRRNNPDPRMPDNRTRQEDVRIAGETYWLDPSMDATDPEHLEVDNSPNDYSHQGLVDSITEGTISMPHSTSQAIRDAEIDQYEINQAAEEIISATMPGPLDVTMARSMRIRRFQLARTAVGVNGPMLRLLNRDLSRRYFVIIPDNAVSLVWFATGPASPGDPNTFPVSNTLAPLPPFFHQGELWASCDAANATCFFNIVEFLSA